MQTQMDKYRATRDFGMAGVAVQRGMLIEFDGYNVVLGGRPPQPLPTFKGAIKTGWAVPEASYDPSAPLARPQSANIHVRPADTGNPSAPRAAASLIATAQAEEQIVGNYRDHAESVRESNQKRQYLEVESQDGVPVRTLQTLANTRGGVRTTLDGSNSQQVIAAANSVQIEPGRGMTREELLQRMAPEQRDAYLADIDSRRAAHLPDAPTAIEGPETQGHVVAMIPAPKDVDTMGMHVSTTVGGGIGTVDLSGLDGAPAEMHVMEYEGMRFTTTNGPKKAPGTLESKRAASPQTAPAVTSFEDIDPRRVIARAICRDFPDLYNFDLPLRKKLARLQADFEDRPDVIRAVAAAETDAEMRMLLVSEFPEAFQATAP
jgi:hypothetical protein